MKFSKPILSLLLSSVFWVPAAVAQDTQTDQPEASETATGTPSNLGAAESTPDVPPVDSSSGDASAGEAAGTQTDTDAAAQGTTGQDTTQTGAAAGAPAGASAEVDTSAWTGKSVKGSKGEDLGTVSSASGNKVVVDTRWGDVEMDAKLLAMDEAGEGLKASTTSAKDVQAMVKSQTGDMEGAKAASKRGKEKAKVQPASIKTEADDAGATEEPADQAPADAPEAQQTPPDASADEPTTTPQKPQN
ncbi:MAG: hypothetical protein ACT4OG_03190 [Alphaproteobacteria bacterium]